MWPFKTQKQKEKEEVIEKQRLDLVEERKLQRLDFERQKFDEQLKTIQKEEELKRARLETEIYDEKQKLASMQMDDLGDDDVEDSEDGTSGILKLLAAKFISGNGMQAQQSQSTFAPDIPQSTTNSQMTSSSGDSFISDEDLKAMWDKLSPFEKNLAKRSSDETIRKYLGQKFGMDDATINRALVIIRK